MLESDVGFAAGFGKALRAERERRGVTLAALCAETKVGENHIQALEQEDYAALPGGVFRRGIVRAYLKTVGLDESEWMLRFQTSYDQQMQALGKDKELDEAAWETFADNVRKARKVNSGGGNLRWLGVLALFLVVIAAAWLLWFYVLRSRLRP